MIITTGYAIRAPEVSKEVADLPASKVADRMQEVRNTREDMKKNVTNLKKCETQFTKLLEVVNKKQGTGFKSLSWRFGAGGCNLTRNSFGISGKQYESVKTHLENFGIALTHKRESIHTLRDQLSEALANTKAVILEQEKNEAKLVRDSVPLSEMEAHYKKAERDEMSIVEHKARIEKQVGGGPLPMVGQPGYIGRLQAWADVAQRNLQVQQPVPGVEASDSNARSTPQA